MKKKHITKVILAGTVMQVSDCSLWVSLWFWVGVFKQNSVRNPAASIRHINAIKTYGINTRWFHSNSSTEIFKVKLFDKHPFIVVTFTHCNLFESVG